MRTLATCALLATLVAAAGEAPSEADKRGWLSSYDAARAEAKRTGKPILLVFR